MLGKYLRHSPELRATGCALADCLGRGPGARTRAVWLASASWMMPELERIRSDAGLPVIGADRARLQVGDPGVGHAGRPEVRVDQALPGGAVELGRLLGDGVHVRDLVEQPAAGERAEALLALDVDEHAHGGAHVSLRDHGLELVGGS